MNQMRYNQKIPSTPEVFAEMERMRRDGANWAEIGSRWGVTGAQARHRLEWFLRESLWPAMPTDPPRPRAEDYPDRQSYFNAETDWAEASGYRAAFDVMAKVVYQRMNPLKVSVSTTRTPVHPQCPYCLCVREEVLC